MGVKYFNHSVEVILFYLLLFFPRFPLFTIYSFLLLFEKPSQNFKNSDLASLQSFYTVLAVEYLGQNDRWTWLLLQQRLYFMCIFLMVATNEMCKLKVKFTLFSPPCDINWWYSLNKNYLIFFKVIFFFSFWSDIGGLFLVSSVHEMKKKLVLLPQISAAFEKKINVLFGKFCYFWTVLLSIGLQKLLV